MANWIGYRWLAERYDVRAVQPFRAESAISGSRSTLREEGYAQEFYPAQFEPAATLGGHLTFALKHEGVHLEFLARLFAALKPAELDAWVSSEPTGQYARRAGFFYEHLTGRRLAFSGVEVGNYVPALDPDSCFTAARPVNVPRWRVRASVTWASCSIAS